MTSPRGLRQRTEQNNVISLCCARLEVSWISNESTNYCSKSLSAGSLNLPLIVLLPLMFNARNAVKVSFPQPLFQPFARKEVVPI